MQTTETAQIKLQQVDLTFKSQFLLKQISFEVFEGDRIALIGPTGAGKTSLLRLLNRLSEPTSGLVFFEGQDIREIPVIQLRRQVTLVPQESKLLGMTVQAALTYPLVLQNLPRPLLQDRLSYWMEQLHIPTEWLERTEVQLSVGQRQLVAITRALMMQPKVLLLDEPTSALDAGRGVHVLKVLSHLARTEKVTILMTNHQLDVAQQFCSRVLHLQQGEIMQDLAAEQANWQDLREALIKAEMQEAQDWQ